MRGGSTAGGMLQTSQRIGNAIGAAVISAVFYAAVSRGAATPAPDRAGRLRARPTRLGLVVSVVFAVAGAGRGDPGPAPQPRARSAARQRWEQPARRTTRPRLGRQLPQVLLGDDVEAAQHGRIAVEVGRREEGARVVGDQGGLRALVGHPGAEHDARRRRVAEFLEVGRRRSGRSQTNSLSCTRHCREPRETTSLVSGSARQIRATSSRLVMAARYEPGAGRDRGSGPRLRRRS